ncbi:hypothetical protein [Dyadobacter sp. 676]|uniref:DUF2938 domain-containing protein n=1 Tax=Dyadobacter sp. 676 TaxID=3088362 RepID=A0AAU8FKU6_9BACT
MCLHRIIRLTCASAVATSAMTVFSYALSKVCKANYREPELLSGIFSEETPSASAPQQKRRGWMAHYLMGIFWSLLYETAVGNRNKSGKSVVFGLGSGIIAVAAWKLALGRSPRTSQRVEPSFFLQLVPAHVVYALALEYVKPKCPVPKSV